MGASEGCEWPGAWLVRQVIGPRKGRRARWEVYQCQAPRLEGPERRERGDGGRDWGVWRRSCWEDLEAVGGRVVKPRGSWDWRGIEGTERTRGALWAGPGEQREAQSAAREARGLGLGARDPSA